MTETDWNTIHFKTNWQELERIKYYSKIANLQEDLIVAHRIGNERKVHHQHYTYQI